MKGREGYLKMENSVLAGIVTFNPDIERLKENIVAISSQVEKVILVDNGSDNLLDIKKLVDKLEGNIEIIGLGENKGIATALNRIGDTAVCEKMDFFLTLDQDSVSMPEVIKEFFKYLDLPQIGLLNTYHKDRNLDFFQPIQNSEVIEDSKMITSGSLMPTRVFESGIRYDERFFIDAVDYDLDFALIKAGYRLYQIPFYGLLHEIGRREERKFLFWKTIVTNHSSFRRYYISRNSILLLKKYGANKETLLLVISNITKAMRTILFEDEKWNKNKQALKGIIDGIKYKVN